MKPSDGQQAGELRERSKQFAYRVVRLFRALPTTAEAQVAGRQLLRCGTSVAANYRAVCRSRSKAEFISRMSVVAEEADESVFWLELMADNDLVPRSRLESLLGEARDLTAIFSASVRTARSRRG